MVLILMEGLNCDFFTVMFVNMDCVCGLCLLFLPQIALVNGDVDSLCSSVSMLTTEFASFAFCLLSPVTDAT